MTVHTLVIAADWKAALDWLATEFNRPLTLLMPKALQQDPWLHLWMRNSRLLNVKSPDQQAVFLVTPESLAVSEAQLKAGSRCSVWIAVGRAAVPSRAAVAPRVLGGTNWTVQLERYDVDPVFWDQASELRQALRTVHSEEWEEFFRDVFSPEHQQESVLYPQDGDPQWWLSFLQQCPVCLMKSHQGSMCTNGHYICRACDARMAHDAPGPTRAYACPVCRAVGVPTVFSPRTNSSADEAPAPVALATRFLFGLLFRLNGLAPPPHCDWDFCLYPELVPPGPGQCAVLSLGAKATTRLMHDSAWTAGLPKTTLVELQFKL